MVLEPAIRNELVELIAANFRTDEINELGRLILRCFDCNEASGTRNHISLSPRKSAKQLVDQCDQSGEIPALIKLAVDPPMRVALRLGIDTGKIISDVINYAAHLEKKSTRPGSVSVSRVVYDALPSRLGSLFRYGGIFEDRDFFTNVRRLEALLSDDSDEDEERFA